MVRYNLINGQIVEAADGNYVTYADVVNADNVAANTLLAQLRSLVEQIEGWYA